MFWEVFHYFLKPFWFIIVNEFRHKQNFIIMDILFYVTAIIFIPVLIYGFRLAVIQFRESSKALKRLDEKKV
jgi:hypothetical protein